MSDKTKNHDVVHTESSKDRYGNSVATVVLADGRVGSGDDFHWVGKGGGDSEAISNAITDARSKDVPEK